MRIETIRYIFRSTMEAFFDNGKSIRLNGEWTITPAFYADLSSIKIWEPPYEKEEINEDTKKEII